MDIPDVKLLMHHCFGVMISRGLLNSQNSLFNSLGSIAIHLKFFYEGTDEEVRQALVWFFDDYNTGCNPPMTSEHINKVLIPAILNIKKIDITLASGIIEEAIDRIIMLGY